MRKNIIRCILPICMCILTVRVSHAQLGNSKEYVEPPGWSLGATCGLADLWGDVGTQGIIDHYANSKYWGKPHFMGGIFVRYSAHPSLAFRLGVNYGSLYADDAWNYDKAKKAEYIEDDAYQRYLRNLNVRTNIWETNLMVEFSPFRLNYESRMANKRFQPYLLLGVAAFHFKPKARYFDPAGNDRGYVNLYDLHIEGDGLPSDVFPDAPKKYSLWQIAVPMGIGVKWDIGRRLALGVEYVYRYTFTDYLDNVSDKYIDPLWYSHPELKMTEQQMVMAAQLQDKSWLIDDTYSHQPGDQRGNPAVKDGYSTLSVTLIFKIPSKKSPWWF